MIVRALAVGMMVACAATASAFPYERLEVSSSAEREAALWDLIEDAGTTEAAIQARAAQDTSPQLRWALARAVRCRQLGYTRASWAVAGDALREYNALDWRARARRLDEFARLAGPAGLPAMMVASTRDPSARVRAHAAGLAGRLELIVLRAGVNGLVRIGAWDEALAALDALQARYPAEAEIHYQAVCILALADRIEPALDRLAKAIAAGFDDTNRLDLDSDLEKLRGERRYQDLLRLIR